LTNTSVTALDLVIDSRVERVGCKLWRNIVHPSKTVSQNTFYFGPVSTDGRQALLRHYEIWTKGQLPRDDLSSDLLFLDRDWRKTQWAFGNTMIVTKLRRISATAFLTMRSTVSITFGGEVQLWYTTCFFRAKVRLRDRYRSSHEPVR